MKRLTFLIAITSFILFSCNQQNDAAATPATFNGSWRMVSVQDNRSGAITTRNGGNEGDVDLILTVDTDTSGTLRGHTPSNDIWDSDYITGADGQLTIPFLSMTKVGENAWGSELVDNIRSARQYRFENGNKLIITTTDKTLTFQRR